MYAILIKINKFDRGYILHVRVPVYKKNVFLAVQET